MFCKALSHCKHATHDVRNNSTEESFVSSFYFEMVNYGTGARRVAETYVAPWSDMHVCLPLVSRAAWIRAKYEAQLIGAC